MKVFVTGVSGYAGFHAALGGDSEHAFAELDLADVEAPNVEVTGLGRNRSNDD